MTKQLVVILSSFLLIISCGGNGSTGPTYDLKGFQTEDIGGGGTYASYTDQNGWPLSSGHVINGVRNGSWTTYHPASKKIKTITNYINGMKNGPEITMNDRGTIESITGYRNDQLHGLSGKYRNNRSISETNYANGERHGQFSIYDERGKIQQTGSFNNGKQHGELLYFDQEGNITVQYEYNNGEKISGGIVEKK